MTEHVVLRRATEALAGKRHRRNLLLDALAAVDDEIADIACFVEMYHRFAGATVEEPAFEQATNADIHLFNNSNNAPAEDARLEDGLSPSKEGGTTSAATDDSAGTSVSSADPDGGGSNSPETANEKVGGSPAVAAPFNAEEAGRTPAYAIRGRSGTSPDADVTAGETAINSAAAAETGKPAGESDGSPAAPLTKKERVARTHDEHPDWTIAKIAAHLNLTTGAVGGHLSALGIKLGKPVRPKVANRPQPQRFALGDQDGDHVHPSLAKYPAKPAKASPAAPAFVVPKGEPAETTAKRGEVAALNEREPWLAPHEAASRLQIPVVNLRIFSSELGITWAQPRQQQEPKSPILAEKAPAISQRVAALRRMHPTWTPALIAAELGIRASDVRAVDAKGLQIMGVTQVAK